jgi:hypothetical protein
MSAAKILHEIRVVIRTAKSPAMHLCCPALHSACGVKMIISEERCVRLCGSNKRFDFRSASTTVLPQPRLPVLLRIETDAALLSAIFYYLYTLFSLHSPYSFSTLYSQFSTLLLLLSILFYACMIFWCMVCACLHVVHVACCMLHVACCKVALHVHVCVLPGCVLRLKSLLSPSLPPCVAEERTGEMQAQTVDPWPGLLDKGWAAAKKQFESVGGVR